MITVEQLRRRIPRPKMAAKMLPLPAPRYEPPTDLAFRPRVALAVESMARHMTDEGWQIMQGLEEAEYVLCGDGIDSHFPWQAFCETYVEESLTDVGRIVEEYLPSTVVVQDKREWEGLTADRSRDPAMRFHNVEILKDRHDVFKLTVLKDAQNNPPYHMMSADEMGVHAWIVYYHPDMVCHVAPFVRREHLIRTYHSFDKDILPESFPGKDRYDIVLSGAMNRDAYPLRWKLLQNSSRIPGMTYLPHPGYHRRGCCTSDYLKMLRQHKVSICTASKYGYALRKIVESTAVGCVVVTDLPKDDVLPEIDGNLVRVNPDQDLRSTIDVVLRAVNDYDDDRQRHFAERALWYDYRAVGRRLADDVEAMRVNYHA